MSLRSTQYGFWLSIITLSVLLSGLSLSALAADAPYAVKRVTVIDRKHVFATVETSDVISARARIGGTVSNLMVDEGTLVKEHQQLAVVRDPKLKLRLDAIDARLQSLKSQRTVAKTALERALALKRSGTISQARLDQMQATYDSLDRGLAALGSDRQVIVQQQTEGAVLAPADGRVLTVLVTNGAVIQPGEPIATLAAKSYILRMQLPERHARYLSKGNVVQVGPRGMDATSTQVDDLKQGRVIQVYPELRQGRVVADVDVAGLGDYFVGERLQVFIATGSRETFVIPAKYLFTRFGLTFVTLKGGVEVVVQPGQTRRDGMEILSGLRDGDELILPGAAK